MIQDKPIKKVTKNITVDANRCRFADEEDSVLLFDSVNKCYYSTTLTALLGAVRREMNSRFEAIDESLSKSFSEQKEKVDKAIAEADAKLNRFIVDMTKTNDTIISMVSGGDTSNE